MNFDAATFLKNFDANYEKSIAGVDFVCDEATTFIGYEGEGEVGNV
jgi:hypothetical protein